MALLIFWPNNSFFIIQELPCALQDVNSFTGPHTVGATSGPLLVMAIKNISRTATFLQTATEQVPPLYWPREKCCSFLLWFSYPALTQLFYFYSLISCPQVRLLWGAVNNEPFNCQNFCSNTINLILKYESILLYTFEAYKFNFSLFSHIFVYCVYFKTVGNICTSVTFIPYFPRNLFSKEKNVGTVSKDDFWPIKYLIQSTLQVKQNSFKVQT